MKVHNRTSMPVSSFTQTFYFDEKEEAVIYQHDAHLFAFKLLCWTSETSCNIYTVKVSGKIFFSLENKICMCLDYGDICDISFQLVTIPCFCFLFY